MMLEFLAGGIAGTIQVTAGAFVIAALLGAFVATLRRCPLRAARVLGDVYVTVLRGVPPIAWLLLVYYGIARIVAWPPLLAAAVALGLVGGAYMAEIYRAGIEAVPPGLTDAADALALSRTDKYLRVILPGALPLLAASTASYLIALLKDSALASLITVSELTFRANQYRQAIGDPLLAFAAAAAFYIVLSVVVAGPARRLESRILAGHR
jgi:His/Glu/Gln/Arg/opine family amino acid ABC transporter permease subunit